MARFFAGDTDRYYRAVIYRKDDSVYGYYGPYTTPGMAQSQGTRETNRNWSGKDYFKVQCLTAVLSYEEHYSYEGELVEKPVAVLKWVDYEG